MGVGAARGLKKVDWSIAKNMLLAWVITFPCCIFMGYVLSLLFMNFL
jgi:PiT family inorganic phosphate transporter